MVGADDAAELLDGAGGEPLHLLAQVAAAEVKRAGAAGGELGEGSGLLVLQATGPLNAEVRDEVFEAFVAGAGARLAGAVANVGLLVLSEALMVRVIVVVVVVMIVVVAPQSISELMESVGDGAVAGAAAQIAVQPLLNSVGGEGVAVGHPHSVHAHDDAGGAEAAL